MDRAEHLAWAKERALEFVDNGRLNDGFMSMVSDLRKHEGLIDHPGIQLGMMLMITGHLSTPQQMREHIEGFN